jgi:RNA polymerase sigma factor (sigma-70 family)
MFSNYFIMIKEVKINSSCNRTIGVQKIDESVSRHLDSLIYSLEQCKEQYCLVIDIIENKSYLQQEVRVNNLRVLLNDLTRRESEIMKLAITGLSNKEISEKLNISPETVKTHRKNIVQKVGVRKVTDLKDILLNTNALQII